MMKNFIERWLGTLFGLIFMGLSVVVTVETVMRKVFTVSLQGADELGGYALAIGATIAFSLALIGRTHIRVDVFHDRLPAWLQTALNWLSVISLAAFAGLMAWLAWFVIRDTQTYQSVAQTPWATPLVYPQSAWLFGLIMFALVSAGLAIHASTLLLTGRTDELNANYGPRSTKQEVDEEVEDLKSRSSDVAAHVHITAAGVRP
jgi:TRAP-type C4-dicarboxylate transport system permease small subunit